MVHRATRALNRALEKLRGCRLLAVLGSEGPFFFLVVRGRHESTTGAGRRRPCFESRVQERRSYGLLLVARPKVFELLSKGNGPGGLCLQL